MSLQTQIAFLRISSVLAHFSLSNKLVKTTDTHLGNAANSLRGAESIGASGGDSNGSEGKRGELHGVVFIFTLFLFVTMRIYSWHNDSQKIKTDRFQKITDDVCSEAYVAVPTCSPVCHGTENAILGRKKSQW